MPVVIDIPERKKRLSGLMNILQPLCVEPAAPVLAFRLLIARLGEEDALRWWPSRIHAVGEISLSSFFPKTWPRQKLLLSLEAAAAAEQERLDTQSANGARTLFRLDPTFDAHAERFLRMLDLGHCHSIDHELALIINDRPLNFSDVADEACALVDENDDRVSQDFAALCRLYGKVDVTRWSPPVVTS